MFYDINNVLLIKLFQNYIVGLNSKRKFRKLKILKTQKQIVKINLIIKGSKIIPITQKMIGIYNFKILKIKKSCVLIYQYIITFL